MKKRRAVIGFVILSVVVLLSILLASGFIFGDEKSDVLGFQNDKVYFKMSPKKLERIKGMPKEIIDENEADSSTSYSFDETAYGKKCVTTYKFLSGNLNRKELNMFSVVIPVENAS